MAEVKEINVGSVPFLKLFCFADSFDILLMVIGTIGAVANGITMPIMTIFLGDTVDAFGHNSTTNTDRVVHVVSQVIIFCFLQFYKIVTRVEI